MAASDVCPTEDAILAFLEHVVDPMLPAKSFVRAPPSLSEQQLVAKQVHAVVLLYNYFLRKQYHQLKFEGFEPFCKLAVVQKPPLLAHMKLMQRSNTAQLDDVEKQLSLTEKTIIDACNISQSLDASKDVPSIEGWPVSKVAVFLIDSRKENCFLQFGSITMGVWSVIEKDVDSASCISEGVEGERINKKMRVTGKPLRDELSNDKVSFRKLAFSAVKEATGFDQNDLSILRSDVVYSLSKEKTAARFYMIQCTQPNTGDVINIPIKDVIDSLQGPLVTRSSGQWTITPVVEYFHLLPYARIVTDLLSRIVPSIGLQYKKLALGDISVGSSERREKPYKLEVNQDSSQVKNRMVEYLGRGADMDSCLVVCPQSEDKSKNITTAVELDDHPQMINKSDLNGMTNNEIKDTQVQGNTRSLQVYSRRPRPIAQPLQVQESKPTLGAENIEVTLDLETLTDHTSEEPIPKPLLVKGYTQTYGIDYLETFAPVVKTNIVRILLSLATNHGWSLQ